MLRGRSAPGAPARPVSRRWPRGQHAKASTHRLMAADRASSRVLRLSPKLQAAIAGLRTRQRRPSQRQLYDVSRGARWMPEACLPAHPRGRRRWRQHGRIVRRRHRPATQHPGAARASRAAPSASCAHARRDRSAPRRYAARRGAPPPVLRPPQRSRAPPYPPRVPASRRGVAVRPPVHCRTGTAPHPVDLAPWRRMLPACQAADCLELVVFRLGVGDACVSNYASVDCSRQRRSHTCRRSCGRSFRLSDHAVPPESRDPRSLPRCTVHCVRGWFATAQRMDAITMRWVTTGLDRKVRPACLSMTASALSLWHHLASGYDHRADHAATKGPGLGLDGETLQLPWSSSRSARSACQTEQRSGLGRTTQRRAQRQVHAAPGRPGQRAHLGAPHLVEGLIGASHEATGRIRRGSAMPYQHDLHTISQVVRQHAVHAPSCQPRSP